MDITLVKYVVLLSSVGDSCSITIVHVSTVIGYMGVTWETLLYFMKDQQYKVDRFKYF